MLLSSVFPVANKKTCAFIVLSFLGLSLNYRNRSLTCKTMTLRQSLHKVEHVCYNIKVRGRESGTLSLLADGAPDDDEGFSNF